MHTGIIDITDLTVEEIDVLLQTASDIAEHPERYAHAAAGRKLATLFYEPSTRTRLSFESAMYELGGNVIGFADATCSSAAKGESVADTVRTLSSFADVVAMRHPREGAALVAADAARVPLINAGDGGHCHPTQTLGDLFTIYREKGRLGNMTVGICGDLKYGRTVHSLINALCRYPGVRFVLISPEELKVPSYVKKGMIVDHGIPYRQTTDLEDAIPELDVLYMTRIQRERFASQSEYERLRGCYILTAKKMELAKPDLAVLHPLPRVDEINPEVDADPRACYFRQVTNGKLMRMALILQVLEESGKGCGLVRRVAEPKPSVLQEARSRYAQETERRGYVCANPRCITQVEPYLRQLFRPSKSQPEYVRCAYCETKIPC